MARDLPPLDALRGFEAAARTLSFTQAAAELFVTQSAVSRQVKTLEGWFGVPLFERRHRSLALTEAGQHLLGVVAGVLHELRRAAQSIRRPAGPAIVNVTTTPAFASLWLIPRLGSFRERHSHVDVRVSADTRVVDLDRESMDVAIRYAAAGMRPADAICLVSGEEVFPVCSPKLPRSPNKPLRRIDDLRHHVLLHFEDTGRWPWLTWMAWFEAVGRPRLSGAGALRFSSHDHVIQAAVGGHGVALGTTMLVKKLLEERKLVAPLSGRARSAREYQLVVRPGAQERLEVKHFADWIVSEAAATGAALAQAGRQAR